MATESQDNREEPSQDNSENQSQENAVLEDIGAHEARLQQYRKKILLAGCEPVMGVNYDWLSMDDYPSNELIVNARRERGFWILILSLSCILALFGFSKMLPAWFGGISVGLIFLCCAYLIDPVRNIFVKKPSLYQLLNERKALEFRALNHIGMLEGKTGLAWRCHRMWKYNSALSNKIFSGLVKLSKDRNVTEYLKERKHIRLYLLFMMESQKGYNRLKDDYLRNHFSELEDGSDDTLSEAEAQKLADALGQDLDDAPDRFAA